MLHGGGMLYITILSLLAPLASAGVKGFGIIFSVEPMKGSLGGGTELHIAGAGFAYVTQVLVGGKPCHILEQMTKDGELTAFTPALPQGKHDVEVVFTSGHRAKLRDGQFQTHSRYTPVVNTISQAASVISNVTWRGDLKKMLEVGMNEIFRDTGEKRNATEIMHAYLGTGIEILSDKAGRDEFRCDILETPTETEGVCEVSAGTPAGYYNFTYVLQDGVSMNGYGKSVWEVQGLPYVSMDGQEYAIEVTCIKGGLSASYSSCAVACLTSASASVTVGSTVHHTVNPAARMAEAGTETKQCSDLAARYAGTMSVSCSQGSITVDAAGCSAECLTGDSASVTLGPTAHTVSPAARLAHGASETKQCADLGSHYSGTLSVSCSVGALTVVSSCSVGCAASDTVEVFGANLALGAIVADGAELVKEDCPGNKVGSYTVQCNIGVPSVTSNACVPPPCPAGSSVALALDDQTLTHSSQLEHVHGYNYTLPCSNVNANYYGNLQISCQAATLMADLSTCLGNPCSTAVEVAVGWRSASLSPSSQEAHGNTWTANCFSINEEFSGEVTLTCNFGSVSAVTSGCTQMEVGCRPSGQDRGDTVTVESYTQALQPSSSVQQGGTWSYDCSSFTAGSYEGSVTVTCGALGAYSVDNGCTAKNCLAGSSFSASKSGFSGQSTLSEILSHGSTGTASCANVNQALRGNVQLSCSYGVLSIDASACYAVCTDSTQAIFGGSVHTVTPTEEIADGNSFSVPCVNYLAGWDGNVVSTCTTGSLSADASGCTGLPCEVGNSVSITLYDVTQSVALTEDLAREAVTSRACSSINSDYAGNFQVQCLADVLQLDKSGCTCQTEACSTAPCPSGDTFVVALTGVQSPVLLTQTLQALESVSMDCDSAAPGHDGSLSVLCSGGVLSADVSACAPRSCDASTAAAAATVGSMSGQISATQALAHDGSFSTQCSNVNSGYSGEIVTTCYLGSLVVNSTQCHPSPCAAGSAATVTLANVDSTHNSQAITAHDGSYSANCADHGDFYGSFQVTCAYGALTVDTSTCVENPCLSSASAEVNVGGITASRFPSAEVVHGSTWTAPCIDINWDYAGDVHMSCDKGHVGYDNSSCILMELGCQTTGGENITVGNYTWVLQPSSNVLKDESFQVDCASHTEQKFVGEIRVTCGRLGNYSSVEDLCAPKSCSAGVDLSVTFRGLTGSITTSSALAHLQSETASCESINEVLRGDLRIDCQYGEPIVDTSSCYMVCLPSRPATVVFAGATRSIATPQELEDGKGFFKPCSDYGGYTGSISASCNAGALEVDVSACEGLPCASGASLALTLYDATQNLTLTQELAHGSSQSFGCNTVNSDYAGDATLTCQAQVLQLDSSACSCQAQACSSAPCGASATYSVQLSGLLSTPVLGEELQSLTSTTRSCASAVEGHSGDISILCSGGVLKADASKCSPLGCDATTTPVEVVVGGSTRSISATQAMLHGEHFVADSCSNVDSGYEGSINVSCYLGTLMSSSCRPKPCEDTVKYVTHAGLNLLARLNGDSLGSTSPAPSGFEGTGDCGIFDTQLVGTFSVSCLASEYTLDLGSCYLNTCDLPSAALVHLGSVSKAVSLQTANAEKGTESFDCADVSSDYSGQGQLVCLDGRLYSSVSGCSSSVASACSAAARAPTEKDGVWTIYDPSGALEHGQSGSVSCENLLGFVGTATASCSRGIFSVDVSACEPKTCSSSMSASVQLGSNSYSVQSSAEVQSGSSWTVACSSFDTQYEGDIQVTCLRGEILAASGCKELSCGSVVRQLTYSGESVNVELSASTLMETPETRTPSNFSNSSVHCSALASVLSGSASVSCLKGAYTLDASACAPKDCAAGDMKTPMGSREITLTVDQSLPHAGSSTRSCASVMYGWAGTFTTGCNFTTLLPDSSGCSPASCAQGQGVTVVVGSTVAQTTIPQQLESYASTKMDCASFDVGFAGNISIRCEAAVLLTDVSGCSPVVQEGQVQQAVQVVESAVAFALPTIQGATQAELQAAMESPSTKRAYAATLAASLGVANEEDVIILFIQVLESVAADGRRLSDRRLAGSFEVNVNFQLRTNSDEDDVAAGFASKIQSLGDSSSSEQQIFATTLGANLQAAAAEDPSTSLLQEAAQAVQDTGIQVKHTETPRVAVNYVAVEDTNVTATGQVDALTNDDTTALLVALIAGCIGAFMAGLCCAWKVTKHMRKKKQESFFTENESNQVASLPEDHDLSPEMFTWDQPGPPPPEVFVDAPRSPGGQKAPDPKMETFEEEEVEKENEVQTAYLGTKEAEGEGTDIDELVEAYLGDKKSIEEASGSNEDTSQTVADTPRETSSSSSVPQEQRLQTALSSLPPAAEANEEDSDAEINLDLQVAKF